MDAYSTHYSTYALRIRIPTLDTSLPRYTYTYTYTYAYTHTHVHGYTYTYIHIHPLPYTHKPTHTQTHKPTHTHTDTHTHTHTDDINALWKERTKKTPQASIETKRHIVGRFFGLDDVMFGTICRSGLLVGASG